MTDTATPPVADLTAAMEGNSEVDGLDRCTKAQVHALSKCKGSVP